MQIVIDIPEEEYDMFRIMYSSGMGNSAVKRILNGTPLPKGHGRLIDADELKECKYEIDSMHCMVLHRYDEVVNVSEIDDAPTIIEADEVMKE